MKTISTPDLVTNSTGEDGRPADGDAAAVAGADPAELPVFAEAPAPLFGSSDFPHETKIAAQTKNAAALKTFAIETFKTPRPSEAGDEIRL
jgi:hypothetical protein